MKALVFVNGPMGVGKSAVCQQLLGLLEPGVYLDGDWCWNMRPFQVTDETRAMVLDNITAMLSRFLACPELDYVIFGWVMHRVDIMKTILERLILTDVKVYHFTLLCSEQTLCRRIEADIQAGLRDRDAVARSLSYLPLYSGQDTLKIMTDGLSPRKAAEVIAKRIRENRVCGCTWFSCS